jgi:AbrB family looped-hinge helix DNA binding protein
MIDRVSVLRWAKEGADMAVTVSPKYQVVIPKEIREKLKIHPGQKVQFLEMDGAVYFVRVKSARELRGILKGAPAFNREAEWADEERDRFLSVD